MSNLTYLQNLYGCFEEVENHNQKLIKGCESFLRLLSEYYLAENTYANSLKKIASLPIEFDCCPTLSFALDSLKNFFLNKSEQSKTLSESIKSDTEESLRQLLKSQFESRKDLGSVGKNLEKNRNYVYKRCKELKEEFLEACYSCEQATIEIESGSPSKNSQHNYFECFKNLQCVCKACLPYIESYKKYQLGYDYLIPELLNMYQNHDEDRLNCIKSSLQKLVVYETSCLRNLQYDIESIWLGIESVNVEADMQFFISNFDTCESPSLRLPFTYIGTHPAFNNFSPGDPFPKQLSKTPLHHRSASAVDERSILETSESETVSKSDTE